MPEPLEPVTAPCSSCQEPVNVRRPSRSGYHFCAKPECRRVKQRTYNRLRLEGGVKTAQAEAEIRDDAILKLVEELNLGSRVTCAVCGRTDALQRFPHPNPQWSGACSAEKPMKFPSGLGDKIAGLIYGLQGDAS